MGAIAPSPPIPTILRKQRNQVKAFNLSEFYVIQKKYGLSGASRSPRHFSVNLRFLLHVWTSRG